MLINIDGGVNSETIDNCKECDIVTSGSYVISDNNFQEKIDSLR